MKFSLSTFLFAAIVTAEQGDSFTGCYKISDYPSGYAEIKFSNEYLFGDRLGTCTGSYNGKTQEWSHKLYTNRGYEVIAVEFDPTIHEAVMGRWDADVTGIRWGDVSSTWLLTTDDWCSQPETEPEKFLS